MRDKRFRRSKNIEDRREQSDIDYAHQMFAPRPEGPGFSAPETMGLLTICSDERRRDTPMEKPVAGTVSERNLPTRQS